MTKILLSCDSPSFDDALKVKRGIEKSCGFSVVLDVKDSEQNKASSEDFDIDHKLDGASLLLVFQFNHSNISAWVIFEEMDKEKRHSVQDVDSPKSYFPECIDFSKSFTEGLEDFMWVLESDFGLSLRPPQEEEEYSERSCDVSRERSERDRGVYQQEGEEATKFRVVRQINRLFNRFKSRMSN
jgi:hypothetical protein